MAACGTACEGSVAGFQMLGRLAAIAVCGAFFVVVVVVLSQIDELKGLRDGFISLTVLVKGAGDPA